MTIEDYFISYVLNAFYQILFSVVLFAFILGFIKKWFKRILM